MKRGVTPFQMIATRASRAISDMMPGWFAAQKHDHYTDFGYPQQIDFSMAHAMYGRNGIARAAVEKTITKTWETVPFIQEYARDGSSSKKESAKETPLEATVRKRFMKLRMWQHITEADRRSMVGEYSALILRFADGRTFDQPVGSISGQLEGLVEVIPVWPTQLTVSSWGTDLSDPDTYGKPVMFSFNESQIGTVGSGLVPFGTAGKAARQFNIHPDRVIIWSNDGTLNGRSALEAGYNDLLTMEKIIGAGGEGFWKNAKSAPVFSIDKEASLENMASAMGTTVEGLADQMDEQVEAWQKGFDKLLMIQGMEAKTLGITLPSPEHFFGIALQSFSGSVNIPLKILIGSQTGERASSEDAQEWNKTCMSRRTNITVPNLMSIIDRLEQVGILPANDWNLSWTPLTESSMKEKVDLADKMAGVNVKMADTGEFIFTPEEMREVVDKEPLSDTERYRPEPIPDGDAEALGDDGPPEKEIP